MRSVVTFNGDWIFVGEAQTKEEASLLQGDVVTLPHTWNAKDGQQATRYLRGTCWYRKTFAKPAFSSEEEVWLEFQAVAMTSEVFLNGVLLIHHEGGYSTFRVNLTEHLKEENVLLVSADNSINQKVYPQTADFTFYGGIYREVSMLIVNRKHFALGYAGGKGVKVTPELSEDLTRATVHLQAWLEGGDGTVTFQIEDHRVLAESSDGYAQADIVLPRVHLWDGKKDPYLYLLTCSLDSGDQVELPFGCRTFLVDPQKGFFLNGHPYHLHGVAKHQDWIDVGNATTKEMQERDMELILEIGATTVRLAHYQHPQYFYDLCDRYGLIVWAEIPYITNHMENGRENTIAQMTDLIIQNYHHPSIVCWGLSNEITIVGEVTEDLIENHRILNDLCHQLDATRLTTMAHLSKLPFDSPLQEIADIASYNLYFGWYEEGIEKNAAFFDRYHEKNPQRCIGLSEYGADANSSYQSPTPVRADYTESYQDYYHETILKILEERPYIWATHVWNMFDFAAAGRNEGGTPGRNQKGLVTFDRKTKKDAFYLYQSHWKLEPMLHICGSRYVDRTEAVTEIKVYSNLPEVSLYVDGSLFETRTGEKTFRFRVPISGEHRIEARARDLSETIEIRRVDTPNPSYQLPEKESAQNWFLSDSFKEGFYSVKDSFWDLMNDPDTREYTTEMVLQLDANLIEIPGLIDLMGEKSIQEIADRNGDPAMKEPLLQFNEKLQKIRKKIQIDKKV